MVCKLFKKIIHIFCYIYYLLRHYFFWILSLFAKTNPLYKDLWLICERKSDARDNGYWFFKYLREKQPQINCAYLIYNDSPDYPKVKALGRAIRPNSFAHYLAFECSKVKVSTHILAYSPDSYRFNILDRKMSLVNGVKVFLQHGIIKDDIAELHYPKVHLDLFVCTTVPEYRAVASGYGFPDGVVQRLGLCRYDNLLKPHEVKKQILVMPTWRYRLRDMSEEDFKKSDYYQNFNGLINNETVRALLAQYDYEIVLYLHYELQKFTALFEESHDRVHVVGFHNADVQQLLMESALLVTDFSSVYFDFAYMKKPLVYWTYDRDMFFDAQYAKGYFSYSEDGFGPEVLTMDEVIAYIEKELKNGMEVEEKYAERTRRTFSEFTDDHCEKTYHAIAKLLEKGEDE